MDCHARATHSLAMTEFCGLLRLRFRTTLAMTRNDSQWTTNFAFCFLRSVVGILSSIYTPHSKTPCVRASRHD